MTDTAALDVYLGERHAAVLHYLGPSRYRLDYLDDWIDDPDSIPLSLSLPLAARSHEGERLFDFLDNLLPDSPAVRDRWAVDAGLERPEVFGLLRHYGMDVAGAAEFCPRGEEPHRERSLEPISDAGIARRIRALRGDETAWIDPDLDVGKFSLGGAQAKFALARDAGRWWLARGAHPTTHIFKPHLRDLEDGPLVEFVTMTVAAALRLDVAGVDIGVFDGESSLIVRRFDRMLVDGRLTRIHQEDLCQAMGLPRLRKYEAHGGPSFRATLAFFDTHLDPESAHRSKREYVRGLLFSWLMLNTDAHAKNLSLQLTPDRAVLAPHYDLNSLIPYHHPADDDRRALERDFAATSLATRLVDSYRVADMAAFEWRAAARDAGISADELLAWGRDLCAYVPVVTEAAIAGVAGVADEVSSPALERMSTRIAWRCAQAARALKERE